MKKKLSLMLSIFLLSIYIIAKDIPARPLNVPANAKWNENYKYWSVSGKYNSFKLWYPSGALNVDQITVNNKFLKDIKYFENGKISEIGQKVLLENKFKKGDKRLEWQGYGKWKSYNEKGFVINEICYTQIFDDDEGEWLAKACGEEIKYNEDGTVKEKIKHKLECKYGCEELECKDCIKK